MTSQEQKSQELIKEINELTKLRKDYEQCGRRVIKHLTVEGMYMLLKSFEEAKDKFHKRFDEVHSDLMRCISNYGSNK